MSGFDILVKNLVGKGVEKVEKGYKKVKKVKKAAAFFLLSALTLASVTNKVLAENTIQVPETPSINVPTTPGDTTKIRYLSDTLSMQPVSLIIELHSEKMADAEKLNEETIGVGKKFKIFRNKKEGEVPKNNDDATRSKDVSSFQNGVEASFALREIYLEWLVCLGEYIRAKNLYIKSQSSESRNMYLEDVGEYQVMTKKLIEQVSEVEELMGE